MLLHINNILEVKYMLGAKPLRTSAYDKNSNHSNRCFDYYATIKKPVCGAGRTIYR